MFEAIAGIFILVIGLVLAVWIIRFIFELIVHLWPVILGIIILLIIMFIVNSS